MQISKGDKFTVRNSTLSGKPIIEGVATVTKVIKYYTQAGARCMVRFDSELEPKANYERDIWFRDKLGDPR